MSEVAIDFSDTRPPEDYFFDVNQGKVLIGQLAVAEHLESEGATSDVRPLSPLFIRNKIPIKEDSFEPIPLETWDSTQDVPAVKWLYGIAKNHLPDGELPKLVLRRAGYFNLVPRIDYFSQRAGGLPDLYQEAGLKAPKITPELFQECYFADWSRDESINLGMRFMEANNGVALTRAFADKLFGKKLAPDYKTLVEDHFKDEVDFQAECKFAYEDYKQHKKRIRGAHFTELEKMRTNDNEFETLAKSTANDDELIRLFARYKLFKQVYPNSRLEINPAQSDRHDIKKIPCKLSALTNGPFVGIFLKDPKMSTTLSDLESLAEAMQLFDIIWPMDGYLEKLKISNLEKRRKRYGVNSDPTD